METVQVRFEKRSDDKRTKLQKIVWDIQHALSDIESGVGNIEYAISDLKDAEPKPDETTDKFLEELGLSTMKRYSLADVERLKIAIKWALEGD